jgi:predicted peptidase
MKYFLSFCLLVLLNSPLQAQDHSLFKKYAIAQGGDTMPYRLLFPVNYDPAKKYPVIFFLHGSGERGKDNELQLVHGASLFLREDMRRRFPAFVIFPQCAANGYWSNVLQIFDTLKNRTFCFLPDGPETKDMRLFQQLIAYTLKALPINKRKVYIGGLSMGGMGTLEAARRNPGLFAAAFSICGGAEPATAKYMKRTHLWLFHGLKDNVVDPAFSRKLYSALKKGGADVRITLYPNDNHNSWDDAFAEPGLLPWLFSKSL